MAILHVGRRRVRDECSEWISDWIKIHGKNIKTIVFGGFTINEPVTAYNLEDCCKEMNCWEKTLECDTNIQKKMHIELFNIDKYCSHDVKVSFIPPKLIILISPDECNKWINVNLNLSKSTKLVKVIKKLHQWYKSGCFNVSLQYRVDMKIKHAYRQGGVKHDNWIYLIVKALKNVFNLQSNTFDAWPFGDEQDLPQTVCFNDRVSLTLLAPKRCVHLLGIRCVELHVDLIGK